ncbi:MAG: polymorphic toxin-type HINT domain-containing protein [Microcoleus sp.]
MAQFNYDSFGNLRNTSGTGASLPGNSGTATQTVAAIDTSDVNAPTIHISFEDNAEITAPVNIIGTISDSNLAYYTLEVAPVGGGQIPGDGGGFKEVYRGTAAVSNGTVATFDPTVLANGAYVLKFTAFDANGNGSTTERTVNVAGDLKLGNFRLSFTDLTVPVAGIPINVTRTYDSLNANSSDDFGYGWRMEFRDTDLKTSLKADPTYEELGINTVPFDSKTKVFITLPGGKRETFTFKPTPHHLNQYLGGAGPGAQMYKPAFESQKGSTMTLTVKDANLIRNENGYYGVNGQPFNPENPAFGGVYVLTTKEGLVYEIDAKSGDLLTATDANGNKLTFSDAGIKSSTGKSVTFERDVVGRIVGVVDPDGKKVQYQYDSKGDLVGVKDRENNTTTFKYEAANNPHFLTEVVDALGRTGTKAEYDQVTGRLKQMVDVNGKAVEMTYDPNTSKQIVKDTRGYSTTYFYDTRGNVLQEIDAKAGTITRTYDSDNNLLSETDADGVTALYTYDGNNNLLTIKDKQGNTTRMTYDNRGRATSVVSPTGLKTSAKYDSRGNLIESIDTNGLKTTYSYNAQGQLRFQTAPDGQITELDYDRFGNINRMVDSRGNEVKTDYDLNNRIKKATTTFNVNGQTYTQWMEYDYDSEGKTIASRTSQGNNQSMIYDKLGRVTSMTDVFGNVTSYRYELPETSGQNNNSTPPSVGSVVTRIDEITLPDNTPNDSSDNPKVIKKYDQANNLIAEVSTTGLETRYTYDELGRLAETILPDLTPLNWDDNKRVKTEYSAASRIKSQTDIYANQEAYFYNDIGQLIRSKDVLGNDTTYTYNPGGQVESVTDFKNRTTRYVYDDKARIKETIYFDNSRLSLTYDSQGRLKTETNELNQTTTYEYDAYSQIKAVVNALNERTEFEYDKRRNLIRVTDALGHSIRYKYDEYGQKVETTFQNGDKILMGYDQFGRITSVTDENLHSTKYAYDNLSQLTEIEQANQAKTKYTYDNLARLTETKDANQNITKFEYDDWFRPTATILPMGQRNQTVYDKFGQVVSKTDFNGDKINYTYDTLGRLNQKTFTDPRISPVSYTYDPVTSQLRTVTDGRGVTQYAYDTRDRLKTTTTPDLKTVGYGYDLLNNITSLTTGAGTTTYGYDQLNRLDTVKEGNRILADYDYDKVGNLIQTKFADSSVESRKYDTRDRLTELTTKNVTGTVFSGFNYTLDAVGNRKKVEEYNGRTVDYSYDALNRLTEEKIADTTVGNRTIGYGYDLVGNRLTKTDTLSGSTTYSYDNNNRLNRTTEGSKLTNFTYDNNGSLKTRSSGTETVTYDWINDGENRLIGVNNGTSGSQFVYDAFGSRVAAINNGVRTNYLTAPIWSLPSVLMEYDATGAVKADYTQGLGLVKSSHDNREGFYHTDGLGSTRAITDNVGLVTDRYTYDAFGGLLNQTGTFGNSFGFAGEQRDSATGLDYLRARYYDSSLGRFISKDAFPGYLDDPMSQHDYQYAHANPVSNTDPSGYFSMGDMMAMLSTISSLAAIGGVSFGTGYIAGAAAGGASGEEVLGMFGEWGAGFASGVSGGFLTDVYEYSTGNKIEPNHAMLYNAGNVTGISVSFITGMKAATWATSGIGPLKWVAAVNTGLDVYGAGKATSNLYQSYQDNGKFEREDAWNLLAYVPFAGVVLGGIKGFLGANRALQNADALTKAGNCFVAGTEVLTVDGIKNIEDIQVGDWVIADDPTTPGGIEARQVLETFVRETDALVDLYVDGEVISTTGEHPFWVADKGWVEAKDLVVGSLLQTGDGRIVDVDKVERREGKFPVYNFNVEGFHTYFVSDLGVLVHNAGYGGGQSAQEIYDQLPDKLKKKTVATDGNIQTLSGYNPNLKPPNFTHVPADDVIQRGQQIGHTFPSSGAFDRGIVGQANASHAEVQLIVGRANTNNIEVSRPMCQSCQDFFQREAIAQNRSITVTDPSGTKIFHPNG